MAITFPLQISLLLSLRYLAFASAGETNRWGLCCLCEDCDFSVPGRENMYIDDKGTTCDKLAVEMADTSNGSLMGNGECTALQSAFRDKCCNPNVSTTSVAQAPTAAPNYGLNLGNEPYCDLCADGERPGTGHTIIAMLYIPGTHTCDKVWEMGRNGHILDKLCKPLRMWAVEPCGCNIGPGREYNPGNGARVEIAGYQGRP